MQLDVEVPQQFELWQVLGVLRSMGGTYGQSLADVLEAAALSEAPPQPEQYGLEPPPGDPPPEEPPSPPPEG